jgi:hypothetical protein
LAGGGGLALLDVRQESNGRAKSDSRRGLNRNSFSILDLLKTTTRERVGAGDASVSRLAEREAILAGDGFTNFSLFGDEHSI